MKPNTDTDTDATDYQTNISPDCIDNDSFEDKSVRREMSHTKIPQDSNDSFAINKAKDDTNENDFDEISQKPKIVPQANDTNSSTKNETARLESKILHISQESNDLTTSSDKKNGDTQDISNNTSEFSHNDDDEEQPKDTSSSNVNPPQSDEYQSKSRSRQRFKSGPVEIRQVEIDVEHSEREDDNETAALIESNNDNTDSIDDYEIEAPYDVYSILLITPSYWRCHFFFVLFVFSSQVTLQALILRKLDNDVYSSSYDFFGAYEEDSKKDGDTFDMPDDVSTGVRIAQVFALFIAVITADDALSSLSMIGMVPVGYEHIPRYMRLSSFWLRMIVGVVGIAISLYVIIVSDDIFKMFSDFAAMAFVNTIDNVLFHMCQRNFITANLRKAVREVKKLKFGRESVRSIYCRRIGVLLLSAGIFSAFALVWSNQQGLVRYDRIRIYGMCTMGECGKENEEMMFRNGEYSFETMNEGKPVYQEHYTLYQEVFIKTDVDVRGVIYFCGERWYIGVRNMSTPLEIGQDLPLEYGQFCDVNGKPWIYKSPWVSNKLTSKVTDFNVWDNSAYGSSHLKIESGYGYGYDCAEVHTSEDANFVGFLGNFDWNKYVYFKDDKFIILLGSRWIMTTRELVPKFSADSSSAFHPLHHEWSALYASELTTSDNPSNLKWFAKPNGTINKNDIIRGDLGYPVKGTFLCGPCVNDINTLCNYRVVGHASITIENNDHVVCEYKNVKLYNRNTTLYSGAEFHNATNQTKHEIRYAVNKTHLYIEHHIDIIGTIQANSTLLSISRNRYANDRVEATIVIGRGKAEMYPNLHDKSNPMCIRSIEVADSDNIFDQSQKLYIKFEIDIAGNWKE